MTTLTRGDAALLHAAPARGLILLMAWSCAVVAAGSYLAQPVAPQIAAALGMPGAWAGLAVTAGQVGYCCGLLLLAPLADVAENRRLLALAMAGSSACMLCAAAAPNGALFLLSSFGIGLCAVAVQLTVAQAAQLSAPARRGRTVGTVTSGLLLGILLAWPAAGLAERALGWRVMFVIEAALVGLTGLWLRLLLPARRPAAPQSWAAALASLRPHWRAHAELRRRALAQALLFGVFSMAWTLLPLWLRERYGFSAAGLAWFGLAGAAGALSAPLAGRLADRGQGRLVSLAAALAVAAGSLALCFASPWPVLLAALVAIDGGVQASHVVAQRRVLALDAAAANRLNSLYVACFFLGGAAGSAAAIALYRHGAAGIAGVAAGLGALALMRGPRGTGLAHG